MKQAKFEFILSMLIVGSIGVFVKILPFTSSEIAFFRAVIGSVFLLFCSFFLKDSFSWNRIKADFFILLLSGIALCFNWIFLFQSYAYTSVAVGTVCYYMAPVFVTLLSPLLLHETLHKRQITCIICSLIGIVCISGFWKNPDFSLKGIGLGLLAACFYTTVILLNKKLKAVHGMERSLCQLIIAAVFLLPYTLFFSALNTSSFSIITILLLLVIGIFHTGIFYLLYFSSIKNLPASSIAVLSYLDPVIAILLSALILHEPFGITELIGSLLIIGSSVISSYRS